MKLAWLPTGGKWLLLKLVMCWVFTLMLLRKLPREQHVGGNKLTTN